MYEVEKKLGNRVNKLWCRNGEAIYWKDGAMVWLLGGNANDKDWDHAGIDVIRGLWEMTRHRRRSAKILTRKVEEDRKNNIVNKSGEIDRILERKYDHGWLYKVSWKENDTPEWVKKSLIRGHMVGLFDKRLREQKKRLDRRKAKSVMIKITDRVFYKRWKYKVVWKGDSDEFESWEWSRMVKDKTLISSFISRNE